MCVRKCSCVYTCLCVDACVYVHACIFVQADLLMLHLLRTFSSLCDTVIVKQYDATGLSESQSREDLLADL